jgi:hypothetical protein
MTAEPEVTFRPLGRDDGAAMLQINRACPIVADFTVCFERGPDFFRWPDLIYETYRYLGIERGGRLVGYCMAGVTEGWTGRGFGRYCYAGDARVLPEVRGKRLAEKALRQVATLLPSDVEIGFGLVKEGNLPAERTAEAARSEVFESGRLGALEVMNLVLLLPVRGAGSAKVRRARAEDIEPMASVLERAWRGRLFAPRASAEGLERDAARLPGLGIDRYYVAERGGRMVGVLGAWDMGPFHRTTVLRYSLAGAAMRAAYGLAARFVRGAAPLPARGESFRSLTITRVGVLDGDPAVLRDLLAAAINDHLRQGYHMAHVGFVAGDRSIAATRGWMRQRFRSSLFWVAGRGGTTPTPREGTDAYVDLAMI